jgi:uncharacterized protein
MIQTIRKYRRFILLNGLCLGLLIACSQNTALPAQPVAQATNAPTSTALATATMQPTASSVPATATPIQIIVSSTNVDTPNDISAPLVIGGTLPITALQINGHSLTVELASTPEQRQIGLMNRESMPDTTGMLFVFPSDQQLSFWMRNTRIPLSIAFLDANRVILNIADMQPLDDQTFHMSNGPARYALEVNQGWFAAKGIKAGDMVSFTIPAEVEIR